MGTASPASAISASERIETAGKGYRPAVSYPQSGLAQKLLTVAKLIHSGLTSTVYYVRIDGFDTHARQAGAHQSLLRQVSGVLRLRGYGDSGRGKMILDRLDDAYLENLCSDVTFIPTIKLNGSQDGQKDILKNLLKEVCRKLQVRLDSNH